MTLKLILERERERKKTIAVLTLKHYSNELKLVINRDFLNWISVKDACHKSRTSA